MMNPAELIRHAAAARAKAHAPYSHFAVGAALLTASGELFTGCNIENASFGLTICAERVALFKAVSEGHRSFAAIAICAQGPVPPCGACRQVMAEFSPAMQVHWGDSHGAITGSASLDTLLPHTFLPENLG